MVLAKNMKMAPLTVVAGSHVDGACGRAIRNVFVGSAAGSSGVVAGESVPVVASVAVLTSEAEGSVFTVDAAGEAAVVAALGDEVVLSLAQAASVTATMPKQRARVVARVRR
jgi:hypothetical protein